MKNLVATGLNSGSNLANPSPATSEWKTVVHCNTKNVKVQNADKDRTVTWEDIARSKAGLSGHAKANGDKQKFKGKFGSWKSETRLGKGCENGNG